MKKLYSIAIWGLLSTTIFAETSIPSTISSNTTLTKSQSPYLASSNVTVNSGVVLTIEPGVTLKFASGIRIIVNGSLIANGTETDTIYFKSNIDGQKWSRIDGSDANIFISYANVTGDTRFVNANGGDNIYITHSNITSTARGNGEDCIAVHDSKRVVIDNIVLKGAGGTIAEGIKNDAIDLDAVDSIFISNSHTFNFSDDGIDIGTESKYAVITNNIIDHCNFGISVGENTMAYLKNNIVCHNDGGFQVHNGATINCQNNTLYSNTVGVECYHSEEGANVQSGGNAIMVNTIFYQSHNADITSQSSSSVTIAYSISDKAILEGEHNILGDPMLVDPEHGDFRLRKGSPCITGGSPEVNTHIGAESEVVTNSTKTINTGILFSVFPNPAINSISIKANFEYNDRAEVTIYNLLGKIALKTNIFSNIDISNLPSGIYFLQISQDNELKGTAKFQKK